MRYLRMLISFLVFLAVVAVLLIAMMRQSEVDGTYNFDAASLPGDLDSYLADAEKDVPNLRENVQKRIVWAGAAGARTDLSVVYLHGYSATSVEIRPVTDHVADALDANLFYTRLAGHGRDGAAMAEPRGKDWLADTAEAIEIGRRIGDRILLIGTSTGGTLAAIASLDPEMKKDLAGVVLVSPNFEIANPVAKFLTLPGARWWAPKVAGETRSFEPRNAEQAKYWTTSYPTASTVSLAHLVSYADKLDYAKADVPALFMFSDQDQVVVPAKTRDVAAEWAGPVTLEVMQLGPDDDAFAHLVAGDIASPGQNDHAVEAIVTWAEALR